MTPFEISVLVLAVLANLVVLGFVYLRNFRSATHQLFGLLTLILMAWSTANFFSYNTTDPDLTLFLVRLVMTLAVPLSVVFMLLMHTIPHANMTMSQKWIWIWSVLTVVTMGVAISPLLFPEVQITPDHPPKPIPGPGMILFMPIAIGTIPLGFYYLIKKLRKASGIEKVQLKFILLGVATMFTLIIGFIFVAVNAFEITTFVPYAAVFTLPFTLLTAYTMIRHRLLDIRLALFRGLSYFVLVSAVLAIYGLMLISAVPLVSRYFHVDADILAGAAALLSIPIARYIQQFLTRLTDKFLFQGKADFQKALLDLGQELSATINIEDVTDTVLFALREVLRARKSAILLRDSRTIAFEVEAAEGMSEFNVIIPVSNDLIQHFKHHHGLVAKDELILARDREQDQGPESKEIDGMLKIMGWLDISVVVPLFVNKELSGIILIGDKLSGEPYLRDDLEFLTAFSAQAAVALDNARLYQESLEFSKRLQVEIKAATHELEQANVQLKNLDKAKSEFLSIASHQLRTPLTALRGYVSMLQEGDFGKVSPEQKPILDILEKASTRLIKLINNLLDISRIESGRLELELKEASLVTLTEELVKDLLPNALAKNLKLEFHQPAGSIPPVVVDEQRIRQVMLNFIDNAIKYTESGRVDVYINAKGDFVEFSVKDTGKGISEEDQARLFNKFTRVGGSQRFHTEGTGLGLYVARQIVKEHHGDVDVHSPGENKGSTFTVILPSKNSPKSLKEGERAVVEIKAAEAQGVETAQE